MRRLLTIFLFFSVIGLLLPAVGFSQSNFHENTAGGRKKESKNQTSGAVSKRGGIFKRNKSAGNADAFASHRSNGGGFFHKMFHGSGSHAPKNASLRKTKPGKVQNREQKGLFKRNASKHKLSNEKFQSRQRKERSRNRSRGGSFSGR
jgi:hypothetical protein